MAYGGGEIIGPGIASDYRVLFFLDIEVKTGRYLIEISQFYSSINTDDGHYRN